MKNILLPLISSLLLTGCAWRGYQAPQPGDLKSVSSASNCMSIGMQNLNKTQQRAISEAAKEVCEILASDDFKRHVLAKSWLASCDTPNGKPDELTGAQVYELINKKIPDYSINPRKPWRAVAVTNRYYAKMAIKPKRIAGWNSSDPKKRGLLINTLAHETMHMVSEKFMDRGHGSTACPDDKLVSYGIGDLVQELWMKKVLNSK